MSVTSTIQPETLTCLGVTYTVCPVCEYAYAGTACLLCKEQEFWFYWKQLDEINDLLERCGAVTVIDGHAFIDETKVPRAKHRFINLMDIYQGLIAFGYANGLLHEFGYTSAVEGDVPGGHGLQPELSPDR